MKKNLNVFIEAAKGAGSPGHVLLTASGSGKHGLDYRVELGVNLRITSGPTIETGDLAAILTNLGNYDVLFIDEIHRQQDG